MIRKPNLVLLIVICIFVIVEILFLRPASIESIEEQPQGMFNSIETLVKAQKQKGEIGYTIDGFHYTAIQGQVKQWRMIADQAIFYKSSQLVLAHMVHIKMFDPQGKITNITGDKAYFKMGSRDLDLEENVKVVFPDGFWLKTSKAHYSSKANQISSNEHFYGETVPQKGELMNMWGKGLLADKHGPFVHIHNSAKVRLKRIALQEITEVVSDRAKINRFKKIVYFSMKDKEGFVKSKQGSLDVKSRRQRATYDPSSNVLKFLTAEDDVLIREMDPERSQSGLKYATCQKADFLTQQDKILLSGYPSAYQEHDTITGDLITIYRKRNIVEVTHANAYHEGSLNKREQPTEKN